MAGLVHVCVALPIFMCASTKSILPKEDVVLMGSSAPIVEDARVRLVNKKDAYDVGDWVVLLPPTGRLALLFTEATAGTGRFVGGCGAQAPHKAPLLPLLLFRVERAGPVTFRSAWSGSSKQVYRSQSLTINDPAPTAPTATEPKAWSGDRRTDCAALLELDLDVVCDVASYDYALFNADCAGPAYRPSTHDDVAKAVRYAAEANRTVSVRSGGHSYFCGSMRRDSVHIDLRSMRRRDELVRRDDGASVTIETGNTFGDLAKEYPGTTFNRPEVNSIGVGGFFLHGGLSPIGDNAWLGWGNESVRAMRIVTPNGTSLELPRDDPKLWELALVAGSKLGVVTELTIDVVPRPPRPLRVHYVPSLADCLKVYHAAVATQTNASRDSLRYASDVAAHFLFGTTRLGAQGGIVVLNYVGDVERSADDAVKYMDAWFQSVGVRRSLFATLALRAIGFEGDYFHAFQRALLLPPGALVTSYGAVVGHDAVDALALWVDANGDCPMIEVTSMGATSWVDPWCYTLPPNYERDVVGANDPSYRKYWNLRGFDDGDGPQRYWDEATRQSLRRAKAEWDPLNRFGALRS